MINEILEQELAEISNYITKNNLRVKMNKIKSGYINYYCKWDLNKLKNENPLKNKSENEIYQEYIDEKF